MQVKVPDDVRSAFKEDAKDAGMQLNDYILMLAKKGGSAKLRKMIEAAEKETPRRGRPVSKK